MKAFRNKSGNLKHFVELFNNENVMKKIYPETYKAYQNTLHGKTEQSMENRAEYYDINILYAGYEDENKNTLIVILQSDTAVQNGYCILEGSAVNRTTKKYLTPRARENFLGNEELVELYIPLAGNRLEDIELDAAIYTVEDDVCIYECKQHLSGYNFDISGELTLQAPVISHRNKENRDINIAYYWKWGFMETCLDYWYDTDAMRDGFVRIPSKGSIFVPEVELKSEPNCSLTAKSENSDEFYYENAKAYITNIEGGSMISWDLDPCWSGVKVTELVKNIYEYIDYTLSINVIYNGKRIPFIITNIPGSNSLNRYQIERIYIYRDCFLEGTEITMDDGSKKKIEDLKEGDAVKAGNEKSAKVISLMMMERVDSVAHVLLEDGRELFVTSNHPLVTEDGARCTFLLERGQQIQTETGMCAISEICAGPEQNYRLVSVELEGEHQMYANGILAVDSSVEAMETAKAMNMRYKVEERWRQDYDGWQMKDGEAGNDRVHWEDMPD